MLDRFIETYSAFIFPGFDWSSVPQGGTIVDVGCGIGNVSLEVSRVRPDLKIVLEDRPQVIEKTKAVSINLIICGMTYSSEN